MLKERLNYLPSPSIGNVTNSLLYEELTKEYVTKRCGKTYAHVRL